METNLIIKGGEKELDLFFKAEAYYCSVLAKMWEVKENEDKIDMLLRHSEEFPFPRMNKRGKTTYSIDELISSMEKYDPNKKYINTSKEQDFLSAYETYKNEKKQKPMETNHQKLTELTEKFNKRLDVIINANPNENFVVEDREKSEEMLKNKLHRLRGSNLPLQNQAVEYLQQNILELRAEERNLEIAQGKPLGTLFISQEPLDNLLAIFQKLAERKQELQQAQQQKIEPLRIQQLKEITEYKTSITDFDERGNPIYYKDSNGYEKWYEYNEKGNLIYTKDTNGDEEWYKYDEQGNKKEFHYKDSNGYEKWIEYDERENKIHSVDSKGNEEWYKYDEQGNEIYYRNSNGNEERREYDEQGNETFIQKNLYGELTKIVREITYYPNEINIQKTMAENNEIKSIAEKSLSDSNYLFLFDEKKREEVQNYLVETAKSQNYLTRKPLIAEDYLAISDKLAKEMSSSSSMTKGMTITEISEKSTLYYQKYENALKKEQEILKNQNMEQSTEINKEVKTEQPTQTPAVDYTEKLDYLKKHLKYLGFGEGEQLHKDLENALNSSENEFSILATSDKTMRGNQAKFELFFKKTEKGGVFFNSYRADLLTIKGDIRSHTFQTQHNITAKESINLLEGRAIKIEREVKDNETQAISKEPAFIKLKLKEEKNNYGNYKMEMFSKNFGVDVDKIMEKSKLTYFDDAHKERIKKHLEKGNITKVSFLAEKENTKGVFEPKQGFAVLNPQYKMLNLYDEKMNRVNSNTASQQLQTADNQKKNVPQQNLNRGI